MPTDTVGGDRGPELEVGSVEDRSGKTVVLGVTGCIAAYKACELARALVRDGVRVKVVMTQAATRFVGPLTFRTLTNEPVVTSLWDDPGTVLVSHISLAEEADAFVVAPCTANVLAKLATGRADDMLTTTALATEATLIIAPAMNTHMWRSEATQANVATLRARGAVFVEPGTGELACGDTGEGRLADVGEITSVVQRELDRTRDLAGVNVLVTAGPTYEPIDAVRFIGNRSSGKTGFWIAEEAARRGGEVTLVTGPSPLPDPFAVTAVRVTTAAEMREAVMDAYASCDVVIASAAVSDFRPAAAATEKLKKDAAPPAIELVRTDDILAALGADKGDRVLVGFAAESSNVIENAREKLASKNLDLVVANDISTAEGGFGADRNRVTFVSKDSAEETDLVHKRELAARLIDRVVAMWRS